ncbi:MAG TPA: hypothetical protein ENJ95_09430, partial [Bacteroidetes bacterium]|nr:hypothetical protein [Bacteroidota bacterium]
MQLSYTKVYHPDLKPAFIFLLLFALVSSSELWSQCSGFSVTVDAPNAESYCIGETITLNSTVIGGTAPYTYLWSTGGTGPNEDILATGWIIANLTVVDANGCIAFSNWAHIKPVFWDINIFSSPNSTCEGALELAVSIFGGTNGYDFLWSNGSTTFNTFVNTPGTYSVTVTEPTNGCDTVMNFTTPPFTPNSGPEPQITGPTTLCNGQSGTLSVVGNYASYLWAPNGETTQSISITGPGTYAVTVEENGSNCTGSDSYTVISSTSVQPQLSAPPLLCPGEQGIVSVVNSSNYTGFLWDTGETSPSINGTAPNTYNVTVTDINGCTETGQADIPVTTTTPPTISGPTELCTGQAGVDLTVQPTFNQYLWSTGETTQTINVSNPTVYEVTVTDANGCTTTGQHILGSSPPLNPVIPPPLPSCSGNPVLLEVIGGPFQSYDWSTGETTATILTSQSGTYTVTVSNQNGCTGVADVTVNTSPGPLASVSPQPYDCSGTINLQASGGTGFLWSTGESSSIINVQNSGTYSVTVTDGAGCTDVAIESVTVPLPTMVNISGPTAICEGGAGALTATPGFVDYLWSTGETTPNIDISTPGIYDLIVTDMNGCTASANQAVGTLPSPQPVISGPAGFCTGGVAFLELNNVFANILWSNGENSIGITVASPGNYNVVVTDVNGCTGLDEWPIAEFPLPSVDIVGPSSICSGSSAELSVPGNFSQITWSNGETTQGISVSQNGIYGVTVTDENGCTAADEQQLETGSSLSPQVTPLYGCDGTAELDAGGGFSSYLWANGETGQSISVTANGSYSVTVSDGQGCTGEAAAEVNMPPPPAVEIMGSPAACEGEETALIGSPGFAFYEWSTGETTGSISISQPGNYTLTATDANGCTATDSHLFSNFPAPSVDIVGPSSICSGSSAELSVPNNFSQITWSTGETTPGISVSQNGIYGVTVTDENGCTAADEQQLETGSSLSPQVVPLYGCDGVAELDAGGGFSSYLWGNGETGQSISVTANGSYSVTVSDGQGCTGDAAAEVNMPPPPTVEIMGLPAACEGAQATLSGSPGFAFYEWSTGETTGSISISQPGNYTLTATDANGCTATDSHQFSNFPSPSVDIVGPSSICSGGSVEFSVPGNFSQITWSNGETTPGISVSQNGIYGVTVTDENGCIATDEQQLETGSSLSPQVVPLYGCDGTAELDAGGGFSSYLWANGETGQSISVTANGSYSVTVSDGAGCTGEAAAEVNMPPPPAVEIMGLPAACEGEETALIGSPGFVFYEWSTGETTGSISISQPGNYTLTATDANGCTATDSHQFSNFP